MGKKTLTLGHSPDADDAFMFYAIANDRIDTKPYSFTHQLLDIQTLNNKTLKQGLDISAISLHNYPYIYKYYSILSSGVSMGDNYGPIIVCNPDNIPTDISKCTIAVPGLKTTAYLVLRFFIDEPNVVEMPFNRIIESVKNNEVDAGLVIHEGQITYREEGLHKLYDLGEWWKSRYNRPLPLGINVIHNRFPVKEQYVISKILKKSIAYALENPDEALSYALRFAGELKRADAKTFIDMYVNDYTLDYGKNGKEAVKFLLLEAANKGLVPSIPEPVFI